MAELDRRIRDEGLDVLRSELGIESHDVTGVCLLDGELRDRSPLRVVRLQQSRPGAAVEHGRELPREIVRIRDARVASEASGRGHVVGGVTGEEYLPLPKPLGPVGARVPLLNVLDLDRKLRRAQSLAHVLDAPLLAHVRRDVAVAGATCDRWSS